MAAVTDEDISRAVSQNAFIRGREYFGKGLVQKMEASNGAILSIVGGGADSPYRQAIKLPGARNGVTVTGTCTCPVGYNCKHVAAALFSYKEQTPATAPLADERLPPEIDAWLRGILGASTAAAAALTEGDLEMLFLQ